MIYFTCSECREELEADESIKGTKMKCPACWKEIAVPFIGIATGRKGEKRDRPGSSLPTGGARTAPMLLFAAILSVVVLGTVIGVGMMLRKPPDPNALPGPPCKVCAAKGTQPCQSCAGSKSQRCTNPCQNGKITNSKNELVDCPVCAGRGTLACPTCGGAGTISCSHCYGLRYEGAQPPTYDTGKDPKRF
jgi:hypothetical protein